MRKLSLGRNQEIQGKLSCKRDSDGFELTCSNLTRKFLRTGESKIRARVVWRVRLLPVLAFSSWTLVVLLESCKRGLARVGRDSNKIIKNPDNGRRKGEKQQRNLVSITMQAKQRRVAPLALSQGTLTGAPRS